VLLIVSVTTTKGKKKTRDAVNLFYVTGGRNLCQLTRCHTFRKAFLPEVFSVSHPQENEFWLVRFKYVEAH